MMMFRPSMCKNSRLKAIAVVAAISLLSLCLFSCVRVAEPDAPTVLHEDKTVLPKFSDDGGMSLDKAMHLRRSVRSFSDRPLTQDEVSRLLWAAQGMTSDGHRTVPSAGGLYPIEVMILLGDAEGLTAGIYSYSPEDHSIRLIKKGDKRNDLYSACLEQAPVKDAPACLVIVSAAARTTSKYSKRGLRYVHMEAGHAAQNVCLQAVSLGLGTVTIGAFDDGSVKETLMLTEGEEPLYIMPVGEPAGE